MGELTATYTMLGFTANVAQYTAMHVGMDSLKTIKSMHRTIAVLGAKFDKFNIPEEYDDDTTCQVMKMTLMLLTFLIKF
jgi:hypothetical protein